MEEQKENKQQQQLQQDTFKKEIKFVCLTDTHNKHYKINVPQGDVLIHTGDFTGSGTPKEIQDFTDFIAFQPHKYKIVIAGNHDMGLDFNNFDTHNKSHWGNRISREDAEKAKENLKSKCTYLENEKCEVFGYNIFGSPYSLEFYNWAFMLTPKESEQFSKTIPEDTDILLTHGPPKDIQDRCQDGFHAGCPYLREEVLNRIKPLYHIFGHIHEDFGIQKIDNTTFINASNLNFSYRYSNEPVTFTLPYKKSQN